MSRVLIIKWLDCFITKQKLNSYFKMKQYDMLKCIDISGYVIKYFFYPNVGPLVVADFCTTITTINNKLILHGVFLITTYKDQLMLSKQNLHKLANKIGKQVMK